MIAVENLTKDFGRTRAVRGVSFAVARGEIVGLLGPNGSGKSTIMRVLTGFFPPSSGSASVAGIDVTRASLRAREKVGYLPENVVLYPDMPVTRFLRFCAGVRDLKGRRRDERIEAVIDDCGLGEVRHRLIGKLSKGYRQRVGLAQAILHEPEVLIFDEPTVGLDPRQIIEMRTLVRSLRSRATVLLSTHILPEASTMCDRVVILDHGRIVAEDTAEALTRRLEGSERTLVRVDGPPQEVLDALRGVPGVARVETQPGGDPGAPGMTYVAHADTAETVARAIAAVVVGRGWGLLELRPVAMTLEDLFVRLVADGRRPGESDS